MYELTKEQIFNLNTKWGKINEKVQLEIDNKNKTKWWKYKKYWKIASTNFILACNEQKGVISGEFINEEFIEEYSEFLDWDTIFKINLLKDDFIRKHIDRVNNWNLLANYNRLPEDILIENADKFNWNIFGLKYRPYSLDFLNKMEKYLDLDTILEKKTNIYAEIKYTDSNGVKCIGEGFNFRLYCSNYIDKRKNKPKISKCKYFWQMYSRNIKLTEDQIRDLKDYVDWDIISNEQHIIKNGGHINAESGYTEFEEILKYI